MNGENGRVVQRRMCKLSGAAKILKRLEFLNGVRSEVVI